MIAPEVPHAPAWRLQENPLPTDPGPEARDATAVWPIVVVFHGRNVDFTDIGAAAKNPESPR